MAPTTTTAPEQKVLPYVLYDDDSASRINRVYSVLVDHAFGKPLTLGQISVLTGIAPESSIASRIRDLRAVGYDIQRTQVLGAGVRTFTYLMKGVVRDSLDF